MGTIASLLGMLGDTQPRPWDVAQRSIAEGETGLAHLADLKRKQAAEAAMMERIKTDPALAQQLFGGGPVLGSLTQPQGAPGAGPMTQQTVQPGQPPGAPQTVPGGQDLSQFATQATPPQSTIGSLGPAGQPQMQPQAPRNPLLEMARTDPRAAMMLQQQMQGQQDAAMKRQEQQLKMGTQIMEYLGRGAQGVTDQASLDAFREETARVHPQAAASLPQTYSKEAMQPFIAKALDVQEALTLQVQDLTAQAAVIRARKEGRATDVDNQLIGMGVQPGAETPAQMREAIRLVKEDKKEVSASHGTGQIVKGPTGEYLRVKPGTDQVEVIKGPGGASLREKPTEAEQRAASFGNRAQAAHENAVALEDKGLTPGIWSKVGEALPFGLGNYLVGEDQQRYRQAVSQFAQALLRKESGAAISPTEYAMTETTYFPQPGNSKKVIEDKRRERERIIKEMQAEGQGTGRTDTQTQPASQGTTGTGSGGASNLPPVGKMSRDELLAERDRLRKGGS